MRATLREIRELLAEDQVLYCWSGAVYDDRNRFTLLDRTFLSMVFTQNGIPKYRRLVGYVRKMKEAPVVVFSTSLCYRVTEGYRKGRVLPPDKVHRHETVKVAGIHKRLRYGQPSSEFHPRRRGDLYIMALLQHLVEEWPEPSAENEFHIPDIYLTCYPDNDILMFRNCEYSRELFRKKTGCSPEGVDTKVFSHREELSCDSGNGRIGYPFSLCYGKGVLAVEPSDFYNWRCVGKNNFPVNTLPHVEVLLKNEPAELVPYDGCGSE